MSRRVAVVLGVVQTITHDELVRNRKAHVNSPGPAQPPFRLVEQRGDADRFRLALLEHVNQIGERDTAVDNVFNHKTFRTFDGNVEVLGKFSLRQRSSCHGRSSRCR